MVVQKFKDLMIWDICQQTIAPPLDICHISPDPGGEICHSVFQNGKFPLSVPEIPPPPPPPKCHNNDKCIIVDTDYSEKPVRTLQPW